MKRIILAVSGFMLLALASVSARKRLVPVTKIA